MMKRTRLMESAPAPGTEPAWPSECERLSRVTGADGRAWGVGEQYLRAAFFVAPLVGAAAPPQEAAARAHRRTGREP